MPPAFDPYTVVEQSTASGGQEKEIAAAAAISFSCPPGRDRTYDPPLKRRVLYQLSYGRSNRYYIFSEF